MKKRKNAIRQPSQRGMINELVNRVVRRQCGTPFPTFGDRRIR